MRISLKHTLLSIVLSTLSAISVSAQESFDVVIYGATPSGIAAAVNAAKEGMRVGLFEPSNHFGGMITGGMSNTDFKTFESLGGTYLDFMRRVEAYYIETYGKDSQQLYDCYKGAWYEPHVAEKVLRDMVAEVKQVTVFMAHRLVKTSLKDNGDYKKLVSASFANVSDTVSVAGKVFVDGTYEGDLMASAGADFRVGRESRSEYGELFAGVKYYDGGKFLMGSTGAGDHKIQCYNFRICVTDDPCNRLAIEKPDKYSEKEYSELLDFIKSGKITAFRDQIVKIREIPNHKADINDLLYSPVSLRLPGENYAWPEGTPAERRVIFERHKSYSLGLLYFLGNNSEVPKNIRDEVLQWGLPKDEFQEYGNFPPALYVREARRLKGDFVLTESDTQPAEGTIRASVQKDAIAICDYSMDSHGNGPPNDLHPEMTEGVFNSYVQPYQIPYRVTLPAKIDGLLVSFAVSASHVGFSSLRMEPTTTAIGQATGIAAAMAVRSGTELRDIDISLLQSKLHRADAKTIYLSDVPIESPDFEVLQYFGTQGYFHHLPEYKNHPYTGRGNYEGMRGQHLQAYPYHKANIEKMMDKELADTWMKLARMDQRDVKYDGVKRIDFLKKIYMLKESANN